MTRFIPRSSEPSIDESIDSHITVAQELIRNRSSRERIMLNGVMTALEVDYCMKLQPCGPQDKAYAALIALGDLYTMLGQPELAQVKYKAADGIGKKPPF